MVLVTDEIGEPRPTVALLDFFLKNLNLDRGPSLSNDSNRARVMVQTKRSHNTLLLWLFGSKTFWDLLLFCTGNR